MNKSTSSNFKLGILVFSGLLLLILALYGIGVRQSMFGKTTTVSVIFKDVSGLQEGNNVRFTGINVGSVRKITILSDTAVRVDMKIEEDVRRFIQKNASVSLGSDGLMGNKLLNIHPGAGNAEPVEEGDMLAAKKTLSTDDMLETLQKTNTNASEITQDLSVMIKKVNRGEGTVGMLLNDQQVVDNIRQTLASAKAATDQAALLTRDIQLIIRDTRNGKGTVGALLTDTAMAGDFRETLVKLNQTAQRTVAISDSISALINKANQGNGTVSTLLNDSLLANDLKLSMQNIREVTSGLKEIMGSVKESPAMQSLHRQRRNKAQKPAKTN